MNRISLSLLITITFFVTGHAQNPLPDFSAEDLGSSKVRISWVNSFGDNCIQLMVQSSYDSVKNFKTIFSTESPQLPQNGFVYTLPYPTAKLYFRVFYILYGNAYYFTKAERPILAIYNEPGTETKVAEQKIDPIRIITIRAKDSVVAQMGYADYWKFKDSVNRNTKDTLFVLSGDQVLIKPFNPENYFHPSIYVVTNKDGFVTVKLPEAMHKNYKIVFLTMENEKLFTINHIADTELVIDKTNFIHAGWFKFELYEDNKLKEKNKILLQRDF
ncbi:hypothetical protein FRZ67_07090 [Panacibacter ginsenosidivorans]|uniref:DUF4397 domain-containing protein n=1 Tax=Panacibacter ginsenosidivorans TaxID=1813871 RepID=A0A5B8V836_9BACT|nr:hypothetical protein [Panacibacter ginsenosidivorans]QEC67063.1 hypothetical protein FRZ67_07090 [Panacibacter ginsenosidivorans]